MYRDHETLIMMRKTQRSLWERRPRFPSTPSSPHHRSLIFAWLVFATFLALSENLAQAMETEGRLQHSTLISAVQSVSGLKQVKSRIDQRLGSAGEIDRSSKFSYHFHAPGQITSDRKSKLRVIRLPFMHVRHTCRACVEAT